MVGKITGLSQHFIGGMRNTDFWQFRPHAMWKPVARTTPQW